MYRSDEMRKTLLHPLLLVLFVVAAVAAQSTPSPLTGKWKGDTRSGTTLELSLTVTGTTLTGTMLRRDELIKLTDGKVEGNTFTFKATINETPGSFTGELSGDEVRVWMDQQGRDAAAVLKRVK
jgi:hypothetical protein